jgi:hypothetical protein
MIRDRGSSSESVLQQSSAALDLLYFLTFYVIAKKAVVPAKARIAVFFIGEIAAPVNPGLPWLWRRNLSFL